MVNNVWYLVTCILTFVVLAFSPVHIGCTDNPQYGFHTDMTLAGESDMKL